MEKETRQRLERLTQQARRLLEQEFREQLEGRYDVLLDGRIPLAPGAHLSPRERVLWDRLVAAVAHKRARGIMSADAVEAYLREAAFHTLNRFVALKMLEARKLVQECISRGEDSAGFKEFIALAPGLVALPDKGYRLYVETIFDEIAQEVRALFDRRDAATLLWPRRPALLDLLAALNNPEVASVWGEDETIGWVYQYFNGEDERRQMRAESQAPRNSRELAVRNQFFTPRYVVQFLTDNSLGRTWCEMRGLETQLAHLDYLVKTAEGFEERSPKDPRDLRVLDPACGSGHFLLYAFDLFAGDPTRGFVGIYEEAWRAEPAPKSEVTGRTLREDYESEPALRRVVPELILRYNLHGIDIDPRAAQIAALALWMRAQRAYNNHKVSANERPLIGRTNIVTAEPMPGDRSMVAEFASTLRPQVLGELFQRMVEEMRLAGELGSLLKIDGVLQSAVAKARTQFVREQKEPQVLLPGFDRPRKAQLEFDLSGVSDESFFDSAEERIVHALQEYAASAPAVMSVRRQLFADDAAHGIAFIDLSRKRFDVVLMNPPFGAASLAAKKEFESAYPRTKNDVYAAFVERGIELLHPTGYLGAITSRTGFFLSSFQKWREEILLKEAPPTVFADLGQGVLDSAMVEVAAYCLRKEATA
ncbi:MAG: Eco57I restriction-modification methylase domain-containing protein [Sterolibacteriaceae bacterium]|nr:Eco57I restriction-modification methylase domain-containing protein [Sterolibacteriaceae bacterium]